MITRSLLDRLESDIGLRRLCGWEHKHGIPSESTFSRAFAEFSESRLPELIHETLIQENLGNRVAGHISRDSTAIHSREKPEIRQHSEKLGHVAIIDTNPRRDAALKEELQKEEDRLAQSQIRSSHVLRKAFLVKIASR